MTRLATYNELLKDRACLNEQSYILNRLQVLTFGLGQNQPAFNPEEATSQLGQEFFALIATTFKEGGFFVEFGAADGVTLSNTLVLERQFDWSGILVEPNRNFFSQLSSNRNCQLDSRAVSRQSGESLTFLEAGLNSSLYTLRNQKRWRELKPSYSVLTVSLNDLLADHEAPETIDYLSIDTEGNEFEVLEGLDFKKYKFGAISVEVNGQEKKYPISWGETAMFK